MEEKETMAVVSKSTVRNSGIELLKIIGILLVVISHVTQTLCTDWGTYVGFNDYYVSISEPTVNIQVISLMMLRCSGSLGNLLFFVSSAWFLVGKTKTNYKKLFSIMLDVCVISVIWLIICLFIMDENQLSDQMIIRSFFPNVFANNWYISCYILFCIYCPFLNKLIKTMNRETHLIISFMSVILYIYFSVTAIYNGGMDMMSWFLLFFIISYIKLYRPAWCESLKVNLIILFSALTLSILSIVGVDILGLFFDFLANDVTVCSRNCNFYNFVIAFSAVNVFKKMNFYSKTVNYISSLSLLVYIIHENIIFRQCLRMYIWQFIYNTLGYTLLLLWHNIFVVALFAISIVLAIIYKNTLQKAVKKFIDCY